MIPDAELKNFIQMFLENFFYIFTQPEYKISPEFSLSFIRTNGVLANLTAISPFKTTDPWIVLLEKRPDNLVKLLTLYSARNTVRLSRKALFDANARLASAWYINFFDLYTSALGSPSAYQHFKEHLSYVDVRLDCSLPINRPYYACSYLDPSLDKGLKQQINHNLQRLNQLSLSFDQGWDTNKIGIISGCWKNTHAVYKNQFSFIEALRDSYDLTFFPLRDRQDVSLFHHVDTSLMDGSISLESLISGRFRMLYYPDIGMSQQSIVIANLRLAPIQACAFGHSVSTYGADIDYYVVGREVEDLSLYQENYSERLVVLPGMGIVHKPLSSPPAPPALKQARKHLIINLSGSAQKCSLPFLLALRAVLQRIKRPVLLRFFVGTGAMRDCGYEPFCSDLAAHLGRDSFEVINHLPYAEYLSRMQEGDLALDSFHYSGCNTIVDSLFLKIPILTLKGSKWYNRIGAVQLEKLGLGELVAASAGEYTAKAVRLIDDEEYREKVRGKTAAVALDDAEFFSDIPGKHFKRAVDYLFANHERLIAEGAREPILIEAS
jgi:hypothetical protein